jgi:hypothetical protein
LILGAVAAVVLACIVGFALFRLVNPDHEVTAHVQGVAWTRSIKIIGLQEVTRENWRDRIASGATIVRCTAKHHHTQDEPAPRATEVCGTPFVVDQGTGHGAVVQDCEYHVYADWCQYTAQEWRQVDVLTLAGNDTFPRWPEPALSAQQRQGDTEEIYQVTFGAGDQTYRYTTDDPAQFAQFHVGSRWTLRVSGLGGVTPIGPAP